MRGLVIKKQWLDLILDGKKTWEIRGSHTNIRELIALIESGSSEIKGYAILKNCFRLDKNKFEQSYDKHLIDDFQYIKYNKIYAWELKLIKKLEIPKKYKHPKGAIIWVKLSE